MRDANLGHRETEPLQDSDTLSYGSTTSKVDIADETLRALQVRYEIQGELGRGGMGIVYRARDLETHEVIALKVLRPEVSANASVVDRFRTELRIARKVTHKRVCRTHELLKFGQQYVISMEFVEGDSLRAVLRRFGGFSLRRTHVMLSQICDGLEEAHAQGIVHRDLKPENIMVDLAGDLKVMDFGIARSIEIQTATSERIVGTPAYMAPEQVQGGPIDARTDIYALGLIAYELLTGAGPFEADTPLAVAYRQVEEKPEDLTVAEPLTPSHWNRVVLKCLEKDPAKRFVSVAAVREALSAPGSSPSEPPLPTRPLLPERWSALDWTMSVLGLVSLALFCLLFVRTSFTARAGLFEDPAVLASLSQKYAETFGSKVLGRKDSESFGVRSLYDYVVRTQGQDAALTLAGQNFPFWEWYTIFQEADGGSSTVWVDRAGNFRGYRRDLGAKSDGPNLAVNEARVKAEAVLKSMLNIDVTGLRVVSAGEVVRAGDVANEVVWDAESVYGLHRRIMVRIRGETITALVQWYEPPSSFVWKKPPNWQIPTAIGISLLVIVLGLLQVRHVRWNDRWRLCFTALVFPLGGWGAYWDISSDDSVRPYFFFVVGLVSSLVLFCGSIVIERCLGNSAFDKLVSMSALVNPKLDRLFWARGILRGTYFGLLLLLFNEAATVLAVRYLAGWQEAFINVEIQGWYVSRWAPGFQIFASALLQTVGIGLIVGVACAVMWRFNSKTIYRVLVPGIIVGLSGIAWYLAAVQPNHWKVILLIIEYSILAWVFVRYDFLTVLVAIFTQAFCWGLTSIFFMRGSASHGSEMIALGAWLICLAISTFASCHLSLARASSRLKEAVT